MHLGEADLLCSNRDFSWPGSAASLAERVPGWRGPRTLPPHLQLVDLVVELGAGPLPVAALGLQFLQLHLQLLLLVLHLLLGLAQDPQLARQVCVLLLQRLLVLVQVGLGLAQEAEGRGVLAVAGGRCKIGTSVVGGSAPVLSPPSGRSRDL